MAGNNLQINYGADVSDEMRGIVEAEVGQWPEALKQDLADKGVTISVGRKLSDISDHPDNVRGVYYTDIKDIKIAEYGVNEAGDLVKNSPNEIISTLGHETGHAVAYELVDKLPEQRVYQELHNRDERGLHNKGVDQHQAVHSSYQKATPTHNYDASRFHETFAESFGDALTQDRATADLDWETSPRTHALSEHILDNYEHNRPPLDKIEDFEVKVTTQAGATQYTSSGAARPGRGGQTTVEEGAKLKEIEDVIRDPELSPEDKTSKLQADFSRDTAGGVSADAVETGSELAADVAETGSRLSKAMDAAGTVLKIGGKALPVVGGVMAGVEVSGLTGKAHAAHEAGDITTAEYAALEAIYGAHVLQGAADPTGFGGEIAVQKAYGELSEGWPPELQDSLRPSSLGDLFEGGGEKSAEQSQFERVVEGLEGDNINLSPEASRLAELYNDVVEAEENYETAIQNQGIGINQEAMTAEAEMDEAYEEFEEHYESLEESGQIAAIERELTGEETQYAEASSNESNVIEGNFTGPDSVAEGDEGLTRQAEQAGLETNLPPEVVANAQIEQTQTYAYNSLG